jgi:glutathione peroxidase
MRIYDYQVKDVKGKMVNMVDYRDKVLLIVYTATGCGFTPQYKGLQYLYEKYREQGFEILDFPCNQFANQAPGTGEEISSFCQLMEHKIVHHQCLEIPILRQKYKSQHE